MFSYSIIPVKGHRATVIEAECYDFMTREYVRAKGEAIRHPDDKHDDTLATTLATARALKSLANKLERRANGRIKCNDDNARKAQVSEEEIDYFTNTIDTEAFLDDGRDRCQGIKTDGEQCTKAARPSKQYCGHHS